MKLFSGFPAGKLEVTPLPNLFFSELCPAIDDLAELKVTLHVFWLLANRKGSAPRYVTVSELRADRTLMQSLVLNDANKPDDALTHALAAASERGTLLRRTVDSGDDRYFINNDVGRRAYEKIESADENLPRGAAREPASTEERPNIFVLYEQSFGLLLTQTNSEELKDMEQDYPEEWIADALKKTALQGKKSLNYTRKILERWKTEGRGDKSGKGKTWYGDEHSQFIKR